MYWRILLGASWYIVYLVYQTYKFDFDFFLSIEKIGQFTATCQYLVGVWACRVVCKSVLDIDMKSIPVYCSFCWWSYAFFILILTLSLRHMICYALMQSNFDCWQTKSFGADQCRFVFVDNNSPWVIYWLMNTLRNSHTYYTIVSASSV